MKSSVLFFAFITLICLSVTSGFAQKPALATSKPKNQESFADRLFFGGNLGLSFGQTTFIDISPLVGYKISEDFAAGLGLTYQYFEDKSYTPSYSTSVYGGRIFGRYYIPIVENLFAHAEYEVLNYDALFVSSSGIYDIRRITGSNVLVGGGYRFPVGNNAGLDLMVLYNLNDNAQSLYSNPVIRMGFTFGL